MSEPQLRPAVPLRIEPVACLDGNSLMYDLPLELARLRARERPMPERHAQVTLFHRPPVAHVLYAFDAGGTLVRHCANGLVSLLVLEGRLIVEADGRQRELCAGRSGHVLVLTPNVVFEVHAVEPSAMLLALHAEGRPQGPRSGGRDLPMGVPVGVEPGGLVG